jgi:glycosyltransferase involved in cell wall biosynthesis
MRVLWFTNIPLPAVDRRTGRATVGSGHWMNALLAGLTSRPGISLGVATAYPGLPDLDFQEDGVAYFVHGQPRFQSHLGHRRRDLEACRAIVERFQPDVVHVHGSERFFGLLGARGLVRQPVVVSLQGFVGACLPEFFGALSPLEVARASRLREVLTRRGLAWDYVEFARGARQEREILRGCRAFLGRTAWDEAQLRRENAAAAYFHVGEALRPEFAGRQWSLGGCRRRSLLVTNAGNPRRGVEVVLDAVRSLARRWPDVTVRFAGAVSDRTGYGRLLHERIAAAGLRDRARFVGFLSADALARELATAHAYVIASFVENSPNSLCEAMRVGTPSVASYAGGIPSLVDDERTGLLFPPGDDAMLARQLDRVFRDDALAARLGEAARAAAAERHDPIRVVGQLAAAYEAVAGRPGATASEVA